MPTENRSSNTEMVSMPREHELKIRQTPLADLLSGMKTGEVRDCSDREFASGDTVLLREVDDAREYTGRTARRTITHVQKHFGLPDNLCVLSYGQPAQQGQGEPVGYQIRSITDRLGSQWTAWRPCCDTERAMHSPEAGSFNRFGIMRQIRPVFAHADPAEVAQAKALAETAADQVVKLLAQLRDANDKLAERDALLCDFCAHSALICGDLLRLAREDDFATTDPIRTRAYSAMDHARKVKKTLSASAEPSAPVMQIPEGYCVMPRRLTAENGAKALLLGEFKLEVTQECPECAELEEPAEGCEICDGAGEYGQRHTIPWDKIQFIYSEAVKGLALKQ